MEAPLASARLAAVIEFRRVLPPLSVPPHRKEGEKFANKEVSRRRRRLVSNNQSRVSIVKGPE